MNTRWQSLSDSAFNSIFPGLSMHASNIQGGKTYTLLAYKRNVPFIYFLNFHISGLELSISAPHNTVFFFLKCGVYKNKVFYEARIEDIDLVLFCFETLNFFTVCFAELFILNKYKIHLNYYSCQKSNKI